jgi:HAD superfamily hydrolase (TIGR01484 family)
MAVIRMLATDLDGTLIGSVNEFPLYDDFRDKVQQLRETNGAVWVACTGRTLSSFRQLLSPMRTMEITPDYAIVRHAYIYSVGRHRWYIPHILWNLRIRYLMWANELYVRDAIYEWHDMITSVSLGVTTIRRKKDRLCMRFDTEEAAAVAVNLLEEKVKPYRHLQVFRFKTEVDVRSVPFTKGLALSELARHLEIPPSEVLAIGNGHNDISMMSDNVAKLVGCPSNSEDKVIETVHEAGGHIASKRSLGGVLEIIDAYQKGTVCSDFPEGWKDPSQGDNPISRRPSHHGRRHPGSLIRWLLILAIGGVALLVFASFDLIPFA